MKRTLRVNFIDGDSVDFDLVRLIEVKLPTPTIEFRQLKDGGYNLLYTKGFTDDFTKIKSFEIVRED